MCQKLATNFNLNKDPAFTKAQEYIKAGGKVAAIKAKYSLSQEVEQQLTTL